MAFTKKHKEELVEQYTQWLSESQGAFMLEYTRMGMKEVDALRAKVREAGGQTHVVKNTLMVMALEKAGISHPARLTQTTMLGFTRGDVAVLAKIFNDAAKSDVFKLKGGFMDGQQLTAAEVGALATLPPLPVMRATLLGLLNTPATKLVRTLAEPARALAYVIQEHSRQDPIPMTA